MNQVTIGSLDINVSFNHGLPFLTMEHIMSQLRSMSWKLVRQFLPWSATIINLNFLNVISSFCRSARLTSKTQLLRPSDEILVPWLLVTSVFPIFLMLNLAGAFRSYQSFLENGSNTFFMAVFLPPFVGHLFLLTTMVLLREPKGLFILFSAILSLLDLGLGLLFVVCH